MNIPCSIHGGPLDGTTLHLHPRVNRLTVPVVIQAACATWEAADLLTRSNPLFEQFRYVISLEQYPIPASGPTLIGYPEL